MILSPREIFTIVRVLEDHTDTSTNYVRAVIRNSRTGATLDTVDLTDQGSRRFTYAWQVPADTSGQGMYIDIMVSVYTDSGYTSKNPNYGDRTDQYLVFDRPNPFTMGPGGGADVDYKKIKKIVEEVVATVPEPETPEKIDLAPIQGTVSLILGKLNALRIPEPPQMPVFDLQPILSALSDLGRTLKRIEAQEPDLSPILKAISAQEDTELSALSDAITKAESILVKMEKFYGKDIEDMRSAVSDLKATLEAIPYVVMREQTPAPKKPRVLS